MYRTISSLERRIKFEIAYDESIFIWNSDVSDNESQIIGIISVDDKYVMTEEEYWNKLDNIKNYNDNCLLILLWRTTLIPYIVSWLDISFICSVWEIK